MNYGPHSIESITNATRRDFLRSLVGGAALAAGYPALAYDVTAPRVNKPRVVHTLSQYVCTAQQIETSIVRDFLSEGLKTLTGTQKVADAWHALLKPDDRILIKCNQSGRDRIGTTPPLIDEILRSLVMAEFDLEKVTVLEARPLGMVPKTARPDLRWQGTTVNFGESGSDSFIAALDQATAIINVPFLKTHQMAVMTGSLKNLSHGLIRHPANFHAHGCDPAIGEIVASDPIRTKLRLNLVNALRVVFDKGPEAGIRQIHPAGGLLFSRDPVASDAIGYSILNGVRSLHQLNPLLPSAGLPPQLVTARRLGLGENDAERIELITAEI